jgi:hypothetical protein
MMRRSLPHPIRLPRSLRPLPTVLLFGALPAIVALLFVVSLRPPAVHAAASNHYVTRTDDPAPNGCAPTDCSLREAVIEANANPGSTIYLTQGTYTLTRAIVTLDTPETGDLDITASSMIIQGAGAASTIIDANHLDRAIDIANTAGIDIHGVTIANGKGQVSQIPGGTTHAHGGAIHNHGVLGLYDSSIVNSAADFPNWEQGGAIFNASLANAELKNVTITGNTADRTGALAPTGGGIYNGGHLTAQAVTVVGNTSPVGGGITDGSGDTFIRGTIVAGNGNDCAGTLDLFESLVQNPTCTLTTTSTNITGVAPGLTAIPHLAGGFTFAFMPNAGSPVLEGVSLGDCGLDRDELDVARPQDSDGNGDPRCEMGALERSTGPSFPDVPAGNPAYGAISRLSQSGVIHGYEDGRFGPDDPTLRAQMAALIARALGYGDNPGNPFTDRCDPANPGNCIDDELWNRVAQLASRTIALGYTDAPTCGGPANVPCYAPRDEVLYVQVISFISRAMVHEGKWTAETTDTPALYPNVTTASGHRLDVLTYFKNAGAIPGTVPYANWTTWENPSTRAWFASALWQAIDP